MVAQQAFPYARVASATLAYSVAVFAWAFLWHLVAFKELYEKLGYFGSGEPKFALGLASIILQGAALGAMVALFRLRRDRKRAYMFFLLVGVFHWTMHVLAAAAKGDHEPLASFVAYETVYVLLQWVIVALLFDWTFACQGRQAGDKEAS